jgi:ABC-type dipeptide/oligopeptide/nickel transport system permease subunit
VTLTATVEPEQTRRSRVGRARFPVLIAAALLVLLVVVVWAITGDWLSPRDPAAQNLAQGATPPGGGHWLGTDKLGRDVFSRMVSGARGGLLAPTLVAVGTVLIGAPLGMIAALRGGAVDSLISRLVDLGFALPALPLVVVIIGVLGSSYPVAVGVFVLFSIPNEIRLCRSATLSQVGLSYIDAARTLGLSNRRIVARHLLPNIMPTVIATALLDFVGALVGFAALAFIGLGVAPGSPDWGLTVADGQSILYVNPWASLGPALIIILVAASATLVGDWGYDRLTIRLERR